MRSCLLVLAIAACGSSQQPRQEVLIVERTTEPLCPTEPAEDPRRVSRRAELASELETIDRELDQIDDELAAALAMPASRDAALAALAKRIELLQRTAPEIMFADTPALLIRIASEHSSARERDAKLQLSFGDRHPSRVEQQRSIEALRELFDRQREVELARATHAREVLASLPRTASATKLRQADLRALQQTLDRLTASSAHLLVPSDAPTALRVAVLRVATARQRVDAAQRTLGPRHPEMRELDVALAGAREQLQAAVIAAREAIASWIIALDAPQRGTADPARLARRAELAARARELRREWDALR